MRIAFLTAHEGVEQIELTVPWQALRGAGHETRLLATRPGTVRAFRRLEAADAFPVDEVVAEASPADYGALVLPGGVANPDALRMDVRAVAFARAFMEDGRPVAAICHAPWLLVEADAVRGRTLTSWPSLRTDITNAGGIWVDEPVRVCTAGAGPLVTSRRPGDLEAFLRALTGVLDSGR
ncbi:type 1 glutamine amidotransferase domain-containing protein [Streptomyces sp. NPDC006984]|uniref:type 1 glutamine amidotransferase domain-containing protein n=1 Tax=Streptomyces sp. NPDC006984 TaxID=3155463 RepID=UPI0033F57F9B